MGTLTVCRICLVDNVRMYNVLDSKLQGLYEKLTSVPFHRSDRPLLACYMCYARLQKCYKFTAKCLESENILKQMLNENNKMNSLRIKGKIKTFNNLSIQTAYKISTVESYTIDVSVIKEELLDEYDEAESSNNRTIKNEVTELQMMEDGHETNSQSDMNNKKQPVNVIKTEMDRQSSSKEINITYEEDEHFMESTQEANTHKLDSSKNFVYKEVPIEIVKITETIDKVVDDGIKKTTSETVTKTCISNITNNNITKTLYCNNNTSNKTCNKNNKTVTCNICKQNFSRKSFTVHILKHTGEKPHECHICQRSFRQKITLNNHLRTHDGQKPYKCDICQRSFRVKCHLNNHMRIHTGEKPYKCDVCQVSFSEKSHLYTHARTHTGEKPYKCDVCERSFSIKGHLKRHLRVHTGEVSFKCDICHRSFREKYNLIAHIRQTHTDERLFKCEICQRGFNRKQYLNRHIHKHRAVLRDTS